MSADLAERITSLSEFKCTKALVLILSAISVPTDQDYERKVQQNSKIVAEIS